MNTSKHTQCMFMLNLHFIAGGKRMQKVIGFVGSGVAAKSKVDSLSLGKLAQGIEVTS